VRARLVKGGSIQQGKEGKKGRSDSGRKRHPGERGECGTESFTVKAREKPEFRAQEKESYESTEGVDPQQGL